MDSGTLYLSITGNLQASGSNPNQLHIFIDSKVGGESTLSGSPGAAGTGGMAGCIFDSGIAADFHLILRRESNNFQVDFAELGGSGDYYGNIFSGADTGSATTGTGSINATGIQVAYDDSNVSGVGGEREHRGQSGPGARGDHRRRAGDRSGRPGSQRRPDLRHRDDL